MGAKTLTRKGPGGRMSWPFRVEMVDLDRLFSDAYQRPLSSFSEHVARKFDPTMVGCLLVSERDDETMAVVDGQTRLHGLRENGYQQWPCIVYSGLTQAQESRLFADFVTKRRGIATYFRFRAALIAQDEEALAIAAIVTEAGFDLGTERTATTVEAIAALERVYRRDPILLGRVLGVIAGAWPESSIDYRTSSDMIRGIAVFLTRESRVDEAKLMRRLATITPRTLAHRANSLKEGSGGGGGSPGYIADAIFGVYHSGRVNGRAA